MSLSYGQSEAEDGATSEMSPSHKKFAAEPRSPLPPGGPGDWDSSQVQIYQASLAPPQAGGQLEQPREGRSRAGETAQAMADFDDAVVHYFSRAALRPALAGVLNRDAVMIAQLLSDCERDPFVEDATVTRKLLDLYFTHIATATYCLFPRAPFMAWVETEQCKSPDDKMALYAILAMGSAFATDPGLKAVGKHFADIAGQALHTRFAKFSLQLCHARLMLALYHFGRGHPQDSWDYCGMALRSISALRLNTEKGVADFPEDDDEELDYGFSRPVLEECRRRTFWSGFLMDVSALLILDPSLRCPPERESLSCEPC